MINEKDDIKIDELRKIQEGTIENIRRYDEQLIDKLFIQHTENIHNIEIENNLASERILNMQYENKTLQIEKSRQELERLIIQDRLELETLLTDQAKFLRMQKEKNHNEIDELRLKNSNLDPQMSSYSDLSNITNLKRNHSANINELRKHQLIELHKMRIRQFDNLQKKRREMSLATALAERGEEAEIFEMRINQEDSLQDTRIKQENEAQELRIKQEILIQEILLEQENNLSDMKQIAS